jgi:hypothetical protein
MAVTVHFADGREKHYADATAANMRSGLLVVAKWNTKRRRLDEVAVIEGEQVASAVVTKNGVTTEVVAGLASQRRR